MTEQPMPSLTGTGQDRLTFEDIDQQYRLKIRSFIRLSMSSVFGALEKEVDMGRMRALGVIPVMFFLQFRAEPPPLALLSRVETRFEVFLRRAPPPGAVGEGDAGPGRLLLDMRVDILGQAGSGDPAALGGGKRSREMVKAGWMRGVHVITRPLAPPGERFPPDTPEPLRGLAVAPLEEPYPTVEGLDVPPGGFQRAHPGQWREQRSVWGMQNTDVNQHVNVQEYLQGLEDHFTRLVFGAGRSVGDHRIVRTDILFRKPFFRGQPLCLRGDLYLDGDRSVMLGGIHPVDPEGGIVERPSVFTRMEGEFSTVP